MDILEYIIKSYLVEQDTKLQVLDHSGELSPGVEFISSISNEIGGPPPVRYGVKIKFKSIPSQQDIDDYLQNKIQQEDPSFNKYKNDYIFFVQQDNKIVYIWVTDKTNNPNILWNRYNLLIKELRALYNTYDNLKRQASDDVSKIYKTSIDNKWIIDKFLTDSSIVYYHPDDTNFLQKTNTNLQESINNVKIDIGKLNNIIKQVADKDTKISKDKWNFYKPRRIDVNSDPKLILGLKGNILLFLDKYKDKFSKIQSSPIEKYNNKQLMHYLNPMNFQTNSLEIKPGSDIINGNQKWDNHLSNTVSILNFILSGGAELDGNRVSYDVYKVIHDESNIEKFFK